MATTHSCRLLKLPAELRNNIYDLVFTGTIDLDRDYCAAALLLSCKQINSEASGAYWRNTEFCSEYGQTICVFLEALSANKLHLVNTITFNTASRWSHRGNATIVSVREYQYDLFWLNWRLASQEVPRPRPGVVQVTLRNIAGEVIRTATPWKMFERELAAIPALESQATVECTASLQEVRKQSRYFLFDHEDETLCWCKNWMDDGDYTCGCPQKAKL